MLGHIRRHQKWLWVLIAGATIISFVIFLDPTTGRRGGGRSIFGGRTGDYGSINGRAISPEEFGQMKQEAKLEYLFSAGRWPGEDEAARQFFDLDRRTLERIFLIEKVHDLNIQVGDEAAGVWWLRAKRSRCIARKTNSLPPRSFFSPRPTIWQAWR